jgi:S-DNA-T family DNA segregation ATPase FtsK/SpoIIIE
LTTIAVALHAAGVPLLTICPAPSPLADGPWPRAHPDTVLDRAPTLDHALVSARVVLVDDVERIIGSPLETALLGLVGDRGRSLVVAGTASALHGSFRGLATLARAHRTGVLLRPVSPTDGELLGVRALLDDAAPAGRGVLVARGRQTIVQVAVPTPGDDERRTAPAENDRRPVGAATYG